MLQGNDSVMSDGVFPGRVASNLLIGAHTLETCVFSFSEHRDVGLQLARSRGEGLARVEDELIEGALGLNEDERAALWPFAWSYRPAAGTDSGAVAGFSAR
jgi:hypothetical protein